MRRRTTRSFSRKAPSSNVRCCSRATRICGRSITNASRCCSMRRTSRRRSSPRLARLCGSFSAESFAAPAGKRSAQHVPSRGWGARGRAGERPCSIRSASIASHSTPEARGGRRGQGNAEGVAGWRQTRNAAAREGWHIGTGGLSRGGESEARRQPEPAAALASFARRGCGVMSLPRPLDVPPQVKKPRLLPVREVSPSRERLTCMPGSKNGRKVNAARGGRARIRPKKVPATARAAHGTDAGVAGGRKDGDATTPDNQPHRLRTCEGLARPERLSDTRGA